MITTDHSPSTPDLKLLEEGDFLKAWGGISGIQVWCELVLFYFIFFNVILRFAVAKQAIVRISFVGDLDSE